MTAPLWTAAEAAAATGGRATSDWAATGVSIDTRTLVPGDLFVALSAARDGHDFVAAALAAGAAAALVSHVPDDVPADAPLLVVADVQAALEALGRAARARTRARVVAVTGSVGKTTTKEMLLAILGDQGRAHASAASYNNHWGVPLTLARMPADTEYAVIEIGMNHPGEIAPLARMAAPHVAMITTVAPAHLEAFDSIDGIAREKASILDGLGAGGTAVLYRDIDTFPILAARARDMGARAITFGASRGCHHRMLQIDVKADTTVAQARAWRTPLLFRTAASGRHYAMNALGALAAVWALGADRTRAIWTLSQWSPVDGRGRREIVRLDPTEASLAFDLIDDAYNANPASMAAALEVLAAAEVHDGAGRITRGRRIAFLGDMKELGPTAPALHAALADLDAMQRIDTVHCIGPLMKALHAALPDARRGLWKKDVEAMLPGLRSRIDAGDVVLAKGSLSMGLGRIVDGLRKLGHGRPDDED